jgi:hypothetical protein
LSSAKDKAGPGPQPAPTPPIVDEAAGSRRRLVEIRCGFAEMALKEADAAEQRAREARAVHDEQAAALGSHVVAIDPVATKEAKEKAHDTFRWAVRAARSRPQVEAAASAWLQEINHINGRGRAAQAALRREREAVEILLFQADRMADTAEAARAMSDSAAEACRAARAALAAEQAGIASPPAVTAPAPPAPAAPPSAAQSGSISTPTWVPGSGPNEPPAKTASDWLVIDLRSPAPQAVVRLLRRDGRTMNSLVESIAGSEQSARSCWQLLLSNFVDAVVAAAIDDAWFEFPPGDPFWDLFTPAEGREVARGLAAIGFRYDGFGEFANGRVPSQRDLALAVGSAGLLPVRIRFWPKPDEAAELFRHVRVATDTFIATKAPALTLGELVRLLGRRAEPLADLWNDWPKLRPLLFSTEA